MRFLMISILCCCLFACRNGSNKKENTQTIQPQALDSAAENEDFFPVTKYIRGEMFEIKSDGYTPVIKHWTGEKLLDSAWVKYENFETVFHEFVTPEIDSVNLKDLFIQKKFLDQSVDAFTFTYEPRNSLPDTFSLRRWDVYVDPKSGKVKRVFMIKKYTNDMEKQLTWESGKRCRIVDIKGSQSASPQFNITTVEWSL